MTRGDLEWGTIPGLVRSASEQYEGLEAVVDDNERLTFEALAGRIGLAARAIAAAGVQPGDRVAVWAPNSWQWIAAALGALTAGAVLVPVNTRFKGREAAYVLEKSRARMLFTVRGFLDTDYVEMLGGARDEFPLKDLDTIVVLERDASTGALSWRDFLERGDGVRDDEVAKRESAIAADDVSDIIFTSGTTGRPKGVMATHGQTLRVFEVWSRGVGLRNGDRYLVVNPFFHTFGYKAGIVACLMQGATLYPQAVFDPDETLRRIDEHRITVLPGPPTLYQSILDHPERHRYDLSSLRLAVTGAAVVPVELIRRMREELGFETVLTAYGLTECTGTATMCRPGDDPETIALTSGCAIEGTEVKVVDDTGRATIGEPGEVLVRGYNVMKGYLDDPEATRAAIEPDGWLHTGDIGVMDERGYVRITDRKKDMFIVGGFNVYPAEVENELLRHEKIAQAAVVGASDERLGEVGVAFLVPRPGAEIEPNEILEWARDRIANYKVPRRVELVEGLPLNASGKVLKYELRERASKIILAAQGTSR